MHAGTRGGAETMRKPSLKRLFRVLNTLEDGRELYLSTQGKLLVMPRQEADFWTAVARRVHSITIDEMVYSKDLQYYDHRSYFLERLEPFVRSCRRRCPSERTSQSIPRRSSSAVSWRVRSIASFDRNTTITLPS